MDIISIVESVSVGKREKGSWLTTNNRIQHLAKIDNASAIQTNN